MRFCPQCYRILVIVAKHAQNKLFAVCPDCRIEKELDTKHSVHTNNMYISREEFLSEENQDEYRYLECDASVPRIDFMEKEMDEREREFVKDGLCAKCGGTNVLLLHMTGNYKNIAFQVIFRCANETCSHTWFV